MPLTVQLGHVNIPSLKDSGFGATALLRAEAPDSLGRRPPSSGKRAALLQSTTHRGKTTSSCNEGLPVFSWTNVLERANQLCWAAS
jgi:hypothetical protein